MPARDMRVELGSLLALSPSKCHQHLDYPSQGVIEGDLLSVCISLLQLRNKWPQAQ